MALVTYIEHDGTRHEIEVPNGDSVMQGAVNNMVGNSSPSAAAASPAPLATAMSTKPGSTGSEAPPAIHPRRDAGMRGDRARKQAVGSAARSPISETGWSDRAPARIAILGGEEQMEPSKSPDRSRHPGPCAAGTDPTDRLLKGRSFSPRLTPSWRACTKRIPRFSSVPASTDRPRGCSSSTQIAFMFFGILRCSPRRPRRPFRAIRITISLLSRSRSIRRTIASTARSSIQCSRPRRLPSSRARSANWRMS